MKLSLLAVPALGATLLGLALPPRAGAQTRTTAGVRGKVVDEQGRGLDAVTLDMEFKGEGRLKVTKSQVTDHKGSYVRMGLHGGPWRLSFSKPGYETYQLDTVLSDGGFSELPDVVMKPARAAAAPPPAAEDEVVPALPPESATLKDVYNKAVEASRSGNLDEAERLYKEILEKAPDLGEVHYNLGRLYTRRKDLAAAETELRRAAELMPQRSDAFIALSDLFGSSGRTHRISSGACSSQSSRPGPGRQAAASGRKRPRMGCGSTRSRR